MFARCRETTSPIQLATYIDKAALSHVWICKFKGRHIEVGLSYLSLSRSHGFLRTFVIYSLSALIVRENVDATAARPSDKRERSKQTSQGPIAFRPLH